MNHITLKLQMTRKLQLLTFAILCAFADSSITQTIMGESSNTYAPQIFTPSAKFAGVGLVGNYFSSTQIATIHDPSGENNTSYSFANVQSYPLTGHPMAQGMIKIGTISGQKNNQNPNTNARRPQAYSSGSGVPGGPRDLYGIQIVEAQS